LGDLALELPPFRTQRVTGSLQVLQHRLPLLFEPGFGIELACAQSLLALAKPSLIGCQCSLSCVQLVLTPAKLAQALSVLLRESFLLPLRLVVAMPRAVRLLPEFLVVDGLLRLRW